MPYPAEHFDLLGLVSKRSDRPYPAGRSKHWLKVKNRKHPATSRVVEALRSCVQ
jgi:ATP-dependent DNA ligase